MCWYCGRRLGHYVWKVPGLLGDYCYICAHRLCEEGEVPYRVP